MTKSIHPATEIGAVRLKVKNMERSLRFYQQVIGFKLLRQENSIAELSSDGQKVLLVLEANEAYRILPERSVSGLYHFAILVPDRTSLGVSLRNLVKHGVPVGQGDHLVSEALYLNDPDGNGIEIYADRPRETWQKNNQGEYIMSTDPVDVEGLFAISEGKDWQGMPPGTTIGHVHFHVGNLQVAKHFYCDVLGFDITAHIGNSALFISAGGYHHHIGLNLWAGAGAPAAPVDAVGLRHFTIMLPNEQAMEDVVNRLIAANISYQQTEEGISLTDPFGIGIRLAIS